MLTVSGALLAPKARTFGAKGREMCANSSISTAILMMGREAGVVKSGDRGVRGAMRLSSVSSLANLESPISFVLFFGFWSCRFSPVKWVVRAKIR